MIKILILVLTLSSVATAQTVQWREIPSPSSSIVTRGIQAVDGKIFVRAYAQDSSIVLFVSSDDGANWSIAEIPDTDLIAISQVVRLSDTSLAFIGFVTRADSWDRAFMESRIYRSSRSGEQWSRLTVADSLDYYPSFLVRDEGLDSVASLFCSGLGRVYAVHDAYFTTQPELRFMVPHTVEGGVFGPIVSGKITYSFGSRFFEDPKRPNENVYVISFDRGVNYSELTIDPANGHYENLQARGDKGIFFSERGFTEVGYVEPVWNGRRGTLPVYDVAFAADYTPFLATASGVWTTLPDGISLWNQVGVLPIVPRSVAVIHDTSVIVASDNRIFISEAANSTAVNQSPLHIASLRMLHSTRRLALSKINGATILTLIDAVRGTTHHLGEYTRDAIMPLPASVRTGVYFYQLRGQSGTSGGKLVVY